jgi:transcriptional regulator with XRE-family HTH domain
MISADFGVRVRAAREAAGLSQAEVARQLGINRMYYSLFEAGRYVPSSDESERIAQRFKELAGSTSEQEIPLVPEASDVDPLGLSDTTIVPVELVHAALGTPYAKASAALDQVRESTAKGIRSKSIAKSVSHALETLGALEYSELLALSSERNVDTAGLLASDEYFALDADSMLRWDSRVISSLVCEAIYGREWSTTSFDQLKQLERRLRENVGESGSLEYRERSLVEILFVDAEDFCPIRRVDLAPYVVAAVVGRCGPTLGR